MGSSTPQNLMSVAALALRVIWSWAAAAAASLAALTGTQLPRWRSSGELLGFALTRFPDSYRLHNVYGAQLFMEGLHDPASRHFERAVALRPDFAQALNNRGVVLARLGRSQEARREFLLALAVDPGLSDSRKNLEALETGGPWRLISTL